MKMVIINGSPRKNWNTALILKEVMKGAESAGTEVTSVDLYDLKFSGCRSCLACKRKDIAEPCRCYWKDDLTPLLEKVWQADRLVIGSPVYFGQPTGEVRCLLERATFPALSYSHNEGTFKGRVDVDVFMTMNVPAEMYDKVYGDRFEQYFSTFRLLKGTVRVFPVCDTLQVDDYSKYEMAKFSEEHKKEVRENRFPADLEKAYKVGAGLI